MLVLAVGHIVRTNWKPATIAPERPDARVTRAEELTARALAVRNRASLRYFQAMLIAADGTGEFTGYIMSLGLRYRELQALPIAEAYRITHDRTVRLSDTALRRKALYVLFGETEE